MSSISLTFAELIALIGAKNEFNSTKQFTGVDAIDSATSDDITFFSNPRYEKYLATTNAGAILVPLDFKEANWPDLLCIKVANPSEAFQKAVLHFNPHLLVTQKKMGISPGTSVDPTAQIASSAFIAPNAVIDSNVIIGENVYIGAGVYVGTGSHIGDSSYIYPNVTIRERVIIGQRVIIQPGTVIGSCGFGYTTDKSGIHHKLQQIGGVHLHDDVEIGANVTIDRGRFKPTIIGRGTKIDNLVQIAHGVQIGENNLIVAQTGIAGSAKTGARVTLAAQVGVVGHILIEDDVVVAARGGVTKNLKKGYYSGYPAQPIEKQNRQKAHVRRLEEYVERLQKLEKK